MPREASFGVGRCLSLLSQGYCSHAHSHANIQFFSEFIILFSEYHKKSFTASNPLNWLDSIIFPVFVLLGLFLLFCLFPTLSMTVRRLRDAGYHPCIVIFPLLFLVGAYHPALVVALSGMDDTPPEIPLPYCYAYLAFTAAVCLLYVAFLTNVTKE